ncbi:CheR family methyltransferase [Psychrobacter urativorans]|uniref:CheR family methyltransferase n=1 Tax=Psychrobacter urativorans TaxID=45610 RepID=UPI0012EDEB73|nr:CheR family methyltransferase [Psychrobacter urativorans]
MRALNSSVPLTVANASHWRQFIEKEVGFVLPDEQLQWLLNAVNNTANNQGLSVKKLWAAVQTDREIRQNLLDMVLIPESRFFRHLPSIQFVTELAMLANQQHVQLLSHNDHNNDKDNDKEIDATFRIWSVGCSAGQEVWSLAMNLAAQQLDKYLILGTDVRQQALVRARVGQYEYRQCQLMPASCQQFLQPVVMSDDIVTSSSQMVTESLWQVNDELRKHVNFTWHNIFTKAMPTAHLQQVIMCQNVLIYFRQFDQRDILTRLATQCALGGHIILAPGEGLGWRPHNMRRIKHPQVNAWQKISI